MASDTGESKESKEARRKQQELLRVQEQREQARLAEADDEVARRRLGATKTGGRRSLIKSSPTGLATNLGGTQSA